MPDTAAHPGRRGAAGLAYLDGHLDLYDGRTSTTGEPADMPVSVITGRGPAAWSGDLAAPWSVPASWPCSARGTGPATTRRRTSAAPAHVTWSPCCGMRSRPRGLS